MNPSFVADGGYPLKGTVGFIHINGPKARPLNPSPSRIDTGKSLLKMSLQINPNRLPILFTGPVEMGIEGSAASNME